MGDSLYENRIFTDPRLPILFQFNDLRHYDETHTHSSSSTNSSDMFRIWRNNEICTHWHENLEILCFLEGVTSVGYSDQTFEAQCGDLVIVNTNIMHSFRSVSEGCHYECLAIEKNFLTGFGIPVDEVSFTPHIKDAAAYTQFEKIKQIMVDTSDFRALRAKAETLSLMGYLLEVASQPVNSWNTPASVQTDLVKSSIQFIQEHLTEQITVEDISKYVNFSESYVSRTFHRFTGKTVTEMINFLRCKLAKKLLMDKDYNISECARLCGFSNLSYFAKTYKYFVGELPSATKRNK